MKILYLSYERALELEDYVCSHCGQQVYTDGKQWKHFHKKWGNDIKISNDYNDGTYCTRLKQTVAKPQKNYEIMYLDGKEWQEDEGSGKIIMKIIDFMPDLVIEREFNDGIADFSTLYEWMDEYLPGVPRAWWGIDTHVAYARHKEYAKWFNFIFLAISRFVPEFKQVKENTFWLPLCYPYRSDTIVPNHQPIQHAISFVGRWDQRWFPKRTEMIEFLQNKYGKDFVAKTDYDNMFTILKQSKVTVNHSIEQDLNFRVFEALGAGTEIVTNNVPDLWKIKNLASYVSVFNEIPEMVEPINGILDNNPRYTHNTIKAQKFIKENHALVHRHKQMLWMISRGEQLDF